MVLPSWLQRKSTPMIVGSRARLVRLGVSMGSDNPRHLGNLSAYFLQLLMDGSSQFPNRRLEFF